MKLEDIINNDFKNELKYVDLETEHQSNQSKKSTESLLKEKIKFDPSSVDTVLYCNQFILIGLYSILCIVSVFFGDFLSLINPLLMVLLVITLSSNKITIQNNRYLDVGIWNLISSLGIVLKSFNLTELTNHHKELTIFFTKLFIGSLLLSGHTGFNLTFIIISIGLSISYIFCFINKDIETIKKSGSDIKDKELIFTVISALLFVFVFKGAVANTAVFTIVILIKYFHNSIADYEIAILN